MKTYLPALAFSLLLASAATPVMAQDMTTAPTEATIEEDDDDGFDLGWLGLLGLAGLLGLRRKRDDRVNTTAR